MSEEIIKRRTRTADEAYAALARLCARAEKSSGDARRLMRTWGVPESEREGVLQRLLRERFIDDSRYASAFVRD
ncbi:MAG: RecX family transcriptional regulator, partial [Rikenellaceae bacterium]|nr:RecX family transcriptional regulator [Rikenellaceae bacterium]